MQAAPPPSGKKLGGEERKLPGKRCRDMPASLSRTAKDNTTPTVLVVDDEALVRLVIADYLRDCGYRVFEAGGPEDAVAILDADLRIDVVLTDLELPGRSSGLELARWIRKRHPQIKVILSSGLYSAAELAGELCEAGPPIMKPYDSATVVQRIRGLMAN
jgi:CheY-like chemotaxis protein